jgi:hypothetical protein
MRNLSQVSRFQDLDLSTGPPEYDVEEPWTQLGHPALNGVFLI